MKKILGGILIAATIGGSPARADVELKFGGSISSDIRYRLNGEEVPPADQPVPFPSQQRLLKYGFSRNENRIKTQLTLGIAQKVKAVADVDFVWYGYSDVNDIDAATMRARVDPYFLEANAAYVDIYRLVPHLDVRIGRQVVVWGTADKFNPTNVVNSLDLSDPLLFGKAIANDMIRLDYNPVGDMIITAVWVPIFRPAQLPRTATLAVTQVQRPAPVQEDAIRNQLGFLAFAMPPNLITVATMQPEPSIQNSQVGVRIAGRIPKIDIDAALMYYYGRFGIPSPAWTINAPNQVVNAILTWPRMQVVGADIAGSIEKLKGLGYWLEAGVYFPQLVTYGIYNDGPGSLTGHDPVTFLPDPNNPGNFTLKVGYPEASRGTVIPSTPFLKLTAGLDYSWNKYLYTNLQYVHGFIDEFGSGKQCYALPGEGPGGATRCENRIGEYLVAGADLKLFNEALLVRFFGAFRVPDIHDEMPRFTAVLFPQLAWAVWDATELTLGAFVFLGDSASKFGDPAAGASEIFLKAKFTY
jgi:hypothetical protein